MIVLIIFTPNYLLLVRNVTLRSILDIQQIYRQMKTFHIPISTLFWQNFHSISITSMTFINNYQLIQAKLTLTKLKSSMAVFYAIQPGIASGLGHARGNTQTCPHISSASTAPATDSYTSYRRMCH